MKKLLTILVLALISIVYTNAQTPEFWGMTGYGGSNNVGTIFKTDGTGDNLAVIQSFKKIYPGAEPVNTKLCKASNGKFYGMTSYGGTNDDGVIFEYDSVTNSYIKKFDFGGSNGANPHGYLMQASDGKLYGMTLYGGTNNCGVLFEYDPATNTYTKKLDFDGDNTGRNPQGSLIQASNGKIYGLVTQGGVYDEGVLFEYDPVTNTYTKKIDFLGSYKGIFPFGSLIQASNGKLYGMTAYGGVNDDGVIFEYDPVNEIFTKKFDFSNSGGANPSASFVQATDGKLYGMTFYGGTNNLGVLFEYDITSNTYTKKLDFDDSNKGRNPYGSLMQASNGKLYGMTKGGGANNYGVLFEYDPEAETFVKKFDFDGSNKGRYPYGTLIQASNGKLYGLTRYGGTNDEGVIFEYYITTNTLTKKVDFDGSKNVGNLPRGSLMQASNGKIYGMTRYGGIYDFGVLFEYDPITDTYTKKLDFDGSNKGSKPYGTLIQASNGKFYGMTFYGGIYNYGVIFQYDPITETYTKEVDFDSINGANPRGSLMQASNGKLYGMTYAGGANDDGVLFEYDPATETYTKKIDFNGTNTGSHPRGSLMQTDSGKIYGMTSYGGSNNYGVLFEYDISSNTLTKKVDFDGTNNGRRPFYGSLIQATNGKIYGMTLYGGANDYGVLFEYDTLTDSYTKKLDFDGTNNGRKPYGSLMQASNEKLYGVTAYGGANDYGVLFEFDPATDTYTKKIDFDSLNGAIPYSTLIETNICYPTYSTIDTTVCDSYTVPSGNETYSISGTYKDTLPNACGGDSIITINLTVNYSQTTDTSATACDTYTWHGNTYTISGDYDDTLQTIHGCDSVVTLHLTVNYSQTGDTTATACDSFTWHGNTFTTSGDYNDTLQTIHGCDSVVTLHLTINYSQTGDTTATACDSFTWYGNTYTASGDYNDTLQTYLGCDSVVTLHLTVNTVDVTVTVNGTTLTANETGANYQWIDCISNSAIDGETNRSFTATSNGYYAVIVDNGLCVDTSECIAVTSVGILENNFQKIKIYPNPTTGKISIDLGNEYQNISVSIKDVTGRTLQTQTFDTGKILDFSINQPAGIYFIEINADENKAVVKLLKK